MSKNQKNAVIWIAIACFFYLLVQSFSNVKDGTAGIPYSDFVSDIESGKIANVAIHGASIDGVTTDGKLFSTYNPGDTELVERLIAKNVKIVAGPNEEHSALLHIFSVAFFLCFCLWLFGFSLSDSYRQEEIRRSVSENHPMTLKKKK